MKKFALIVLSILFMFVCFSCKHEEEVEKDQYTIAVIDIDGEVLGEKKFDITDNSSVWNDLSNNFNVISYEGAYGKTIVSINNSVVDNNYYVSILENNEYASTGVDGLHIDKDDIFVFRVECWNTVSSGYGTLTENDVLLDKTFYHYAKKYMKASMDSCTNYSDQGYWDYMIYNLMKSHNYDSNLFGNYNNDTLKNNLLSADLNNLKKADFGKYFAYARVLGLDLASFKTVLESWVNEEMATSYEMYTSAFYLMPIKALNIENAKVDSLVSSSITTDLTWGPDDAVWQLLGQGLFVDYTKNDASDIINTIDWGNGCSCAELLEVYAYLNDLSESQAILTNLFNNYYNSEVNLVGYNKTDNNISYSSSQIYLALAAYKVARDNNTKVNIFE